MRTPYFFRTLQCSFLAGCLLAAPIPTLANDLPEADPFAMYFDESQLVEVATRAPKPISQVAENVTVVTAKEIEGMHVHTLLEVLERQPGIGTSYFGQDYGSEGRFYLQGTRHHHTLVLIDGVRINNASVGEGLTNFIPLAIIKRIEIIKGPASSTWGSSLGGVINIITKDTGNTAVPSGSVMVTYGEAASREVNADLAGKAGAVSYYLHGGGMDSDGLSNDRFYDRETVYGKMRLDLPREMALTVNAGFGDPYLKSGGFYSLDFNETVRNRSFWGSIYFDAPITDRLNFHLEAQRFEMHHFREDIKIGQTTYAGGAGDFLQSWDYDEKTTSLNGRLFWQGDKVDVTVGAETSRSQLDYIYIYDYTPAGPWVGTEVAPTAYEERRGVYGNATFTLGNLSITPGIRYDYHSITEEFYSPSLGATYRLADDTLLRATVARGFSAPYLALISGGNIFTPVNPDLKPETINSAQLGLETTRVPFLHVKGSVFHHNTEDVWTSTWPAQNRGRTRLNGIELEAKTQPWHDLTLTANGTYVEEDTESAENDELYNANLILDYNDNHSLKAQLAGRYNWFNERDLLRDSSYRNWDTNFIWDTSVTKTLYLHRLSADLFFVVHNLFESSSYWDDEYQNPGRWVEGGITFKF